MKILQDLRYDGSDPRQNNIWRIILFSLVEVSAKAIMHMMGFWLYFTQNVLGLGVFLGLVITPMVLMDAITDPLMASLFDKFNSRWGKFKPIMLLGGLITVIPGLVIFTFPAQTDMPQWLIYTILTCMYASIIIGTTLLRTAARAGHAIITQDPRQRPLYAIGKTIFEGVIIMLTTLIISSDLFGEMQSPDVWRYSIYITAALMIVSILVAIKAISNRDDPVYYDLGDKAKQKINITEFFTIIKRSSPMRRVLLATVSDAFAASIRGGLAIYLFSNIIMQRSVFSFFDIVSSIVLGLPILFIGIRYATKLGTAKAYLNIAYIQTVLGVAGFLATTILLPADPNYVYPGVNANLIIVLTIYGLYISTLGISSSLISALSGDLTDYEYVQSGRFMPAIIGALITTVTKIAESFKGILLVAIMLFCGFSGTGDAAKVPENVFVNDRFYYSIILAVFILPAIGHLITVLSMKNYPLDDKTMQEVSQVLLNDRGFTKIKSDENNT